MSELQFYMSTFRVHRQHAISTSRTEKETTLILMTLYIHSVTVAEQTCPRGVPRIVPMGNSIDVSLTNPCD
jgi:hypothetical protein